jgi:hypothetical protein
MLTLLLPSDPEMLSAIPDTADYLDEPISFRGREMNGFGSPDASNGDSKHASHRSLPYRLLPIKRRRVSMETLALLDDERLKSKPLQSLRGEAALLQEEPLDDTGESDVHEIPKNDDDDEYILNGAPAQLTTIATRKDRKPSGT